VFFNALGRVLRKGEGERWHGSGGGGGGGGGAPMCVMDEGVWSQAYEPKICSRRHSLSVVNHLMMEVASESVSVLGRLLHTPLPLGPLLLTNKTKVLFIAATFKKVPRGGAASVRQQKRKERG
jgi:hypothetical protein